MTGAWALKTGLWMLWIWKQTTDIQTWTPGKCGWIFDSGEYEECDREPEEADWGAGGWALGSGEWMPEPGEYEDWGGESKENDWGAGGWGLGTGGWLMGNRGRVLKTGDWLLVTVADN